MEGWITIHRKILEWEWYSDINCTRLFIHLLLKASFKDSKWKGEDIKRGDVITGIKSLSKETGLSEQQIKTCISKLKSTNEITIKATNKYSVITIENYSKYQQDIETPTNKVTSKATNEQQTSNKQTTNNQPHLNNVNNGNNENNDKKNNKDISNDIPEDFEIFWNKYDKKVDRSKCITKWKYLNKTEKLLAVDKVDSYVKSTPDPTFRKNPHTWLNGKCWNDEIDNKKKEEDWKTAFLKGVEQEC